MMRCTINLPSFSKPGLIKPNLITPHLVKQGGFSLIELVIFIIVISILSVGLFTSFSQALIGSADPDRYSRTAQLAQERMELVLAQRQAQGFAGFTSATADPCASVPVSAHVSCTVPAGYTVTTILNTNWGGDAAYTEVVVDVSINGETSTLNSLVSDY